MENLRKFHLTGRLSFTISLFWLIGLALLLSSCQNPFLGPCVSAAPAPPHVALRVIGSTVVLGDSYGHMSALRASDGSHLWSINTTTDASAFAVEDGIIYAGANSVAAIRLSDGKRLWFFQGRAWPYAQTAPVVAGNMVYTSSSDKVDALDESSGKLLWSSTETGSLLAVMNGVVYIGSASIVTALRASDGMLLWSVKEPGPFYGDYRLLPVVSGSAIYISAGDTLYVVRADNGKPLWQFQAGPYIIPIVDALNGRIYVQSGPDINAHSSLDALQSSDGRLLWHFQSPGESFYSFAFDGDTVYASGTGHLYALNAQDGRQRWLAQAVSSNIMTGKGAVFVHLESAIAAWRASDGQTLWHSSSSGDFAGVEGNTLYISIYMASGCGTGVDYWHVQLDALGTGDGRQHWQSQV